MEDWRFEPRNRGRFDQLKIRTEESRKIRSIEDSNRGINEDSTTWRFEPRNQWRFDPLKIRTEESRDQWIKEDSNFWKKEIQFYGGLKIRIKDQGMNQWINESRNESMNKWIKDQGMNQWIKDQWMNQWMNQGTIEDSNLGIEGSIIKEDFNFWKKDWRLKYFYLKSGKSI